jgi:hypothetical protein
VAQPGMGYTAPRSSLRLLEGLPQAKAALIVREFRLTVGSSSVVSAVGVQGVDRATHVVRCAGRHSRGPAGMAGITSVMRLQ